MLNTKPVGCSEKLLQVIKLGSYPEGIKKSYMLWSEIVSELKIIDVRG